ncbi:MAG: DUF1003 domain-containing protein [Nitriliruptoraceae bacterium]
MTAHHTYIDRLHRTHGPFGYGSFGRYAERFARLFGTPAFLIGQTVVVIAWITVNAIAFTRRWDPYPFILLNLVFSLQAAYAAPLILLAQTRQADRDRALSRADADHREELARAAIDRHAQAVEAGERLRAQVDALAVRLEDAHQVLVELRDRPRTGGGG